MRRLNHNLDDCYRELGLRDGDKAATLSARGCAVARKLYAYDYTLWQRHCGAAGMRSNS